MRKDGQLLSAPTVHIILKVITHRNTCTCVCMKPFCCSCNTAAVLLPYFSCRMRRRQQAGYFYTPTV